MPFMGPKARGGGLIDGHSRQHFWEPVGAWGVYLREVNGQGRHWLWERNGRWRCATRVGFAGG
jgi:hypothetical protein